MHYTDKGDLGVLNRTYLLGLGPLLYLLLFNQKVMQPQYTQMAWREICIRTLTPCRIALHANGSDISRTEKQTTLLR